MVGLLTLSPVLIPGTEPQSKSRFGDLATWPAATSSAHAPLLQVATSALFDRVAASA